MKKRKIYKSDVGKIFKVYYDSGFFQFELICEVDDTHYRYCFCTSKGSWHHDARCSRGPFGSDSYHFEEVNALTAIILFGNNIPKEFKGWHE